MGIVVVVVIPHGPAQIVLGATARIARGTYGPFWNQYRHSCCTRNGVEDTNGWNAREEHYY